LIPFFIENSLTTIPLFDKPVPVRLFC